MQVNIIATIAVNICIEDISFKIMPLVKNISEIGIMIVSNKLLPKILPIAILIDPAATEEIDTIISGKEEEIARKIVPK